MQRKKGFYFIARSETTEFTSSWIRKFSSSGWKKKSKKQKLKIEMLRE